MTAPIGIFGLGATSLGWFDKDVAELGVFDYTLIAASSIPNFNAAINEAATAGEASTVQIIYGVATQEAGSAADANGCQASFGSKVFEPLSRVEIDTYAFSNSAVATTAIDATVTVGSFPNRALVAIIYHDTANINITSISHQSGTGNAWQFEGRGVINNDAPPGRGFDVYSCTNPSVGSNVIRITTHIDKGDARVALYSFYNVDQSSVFNGFTFSTTPFAVTSVATYATGDEMILWAIDSATSPSNPYGAFLVKDLSFGFNAVMYSSLTRGDNTTQTVYISGSGMVMFAGRVKAAPVILDSSINAQTIQGSILESGTGSDSQSNSALTSATATDALTASEASSNYGSYFRGLLEAAGSNTAPTPFSTTGLLQVDGGTTTTLVETVTAGYNFTTGKSALIVVSAFAAGSTDPVTSITVSGSLATRVYRTQVSGCEAGFYLVPEITAGGSNAIDVTFASSANKYISMSVEEWDGTLSLTNDSGAENFTYSNAPTISATLARAPVQDKAIAYAAFTELEGSNYGVTAGPSGWVSTFIEPRSDIHQGGAGAYKVLTTAEVASAVWTGTNVGGYRSAAIALLYTQAPGALDFADGTATGGGGITGDVLETATGAEAASSQASFGAVQLDSASGADAQTLQATFLSDQLDAGTATETQATSAILLNTITETGASSESQATQLILQNTITESGSAADSESSQALLGVVGTEAVTAVDTINSQAAYQVNDAESASSQEQSTGGLNANTVITEAATNTEQSDRYSNVPVAQQDNSTGADSSSSQAYFGSSATENGTATDSPATQVLFSAQEIEALTAEDQQSSGASSIQALIEEALTALENESSYVTSQNSIAESSTATEAQQAGANLLSAILESLTSSETSSRIISTLASQLESGTGLDASSPKVDFSALIAEAVTALEVQNAVWYAYTPILENANGLDIVAASYITTATIAEANAASENSTQNTNIQIAASLAESATITDTQGNTVITTANQIDSANALQTQSNTIITQAYIAEVLAALESISNQNAYNLTHNELIQAESIEAAQATLFAAVLEQAIALDEHDGRAKPLEIDEELIIGINPRRFTADANKRVFVQQTPKRTFSISSDKRRFEIGIPERVYE